MLETIDSDMIGPPAEGQTVAGSLMSQLLEVPAAREAARELEHAQSAGRSVDDEQEVDRLAKDLGLSSCGAEP